MAFGIKINRARLLRRLANLIAFIAVFVFCVSIISLFSSGKDIEVSMAFLITSGIVMGFFFGHYSSPIFLKRSRKTQIRFFIALPLMSIAGLFFGGVLFSGIRNVTLFKVVVLILLFASFSFSLGLFVGWVYHKVKQKLAAAETSAAQSKSELQMLESQISPHFLFNTLNNLYGISLREPNKTPGMLLKLSELLRYSVYDARDTFVPLKEELNYLKNYIEFEKIRIGDRLDLQVDMEDIKTDNITIAPMLLVIFVENAFKHAKNNLNEKIQIEISMKLWSNSVLFSVINSYRSASNNDSFNKHSGFGLQSAIRRLELLYPNAHDLKIEKDENNFAAMLRVNIKRAPR